MHRENEREEDAGCVAMHAHHRQRYMDMDKEMASSLQ
jgi:hypothetical protein